VAEAWRVFLDTSALIAGLISSTGAARELLRLCEAGAVEVVVSKQVLVEADRTLSEKLGRLVSNFRVLMANMSPTLVEDPSREEVGLAAQVIDEKDAPILAAARSAKVDYLVTWNTRHFQTASVRAAVSFKIMTPGEFLVEFRGRLAGGG
jgi:putative PIN family toxin of toxin-antitoxin system